MCQIKATLKNAIIHATGNQAAQKFLEANVAVSHFLMGIGVGGGVERTGERAIFDLLKKKKRSRFCIFDVGSNRGQFVLFALDQFRAGEVVIHCFEPGRETFRMLAELAGEKKEVKLNNLAIGKSRGEGTLFYDSVGSELASLSKRNLAFANIDFSLSEAVKIESIDEYCDRSKIEEIDLLKLDIEGHELEAIAGAERMLSRKAIFMISFEFGGCNVDTRTFVRDFWEVFKRWNFALYRIAPSGYLHPINAYCVQDEQFQTSNFVAVRND